MWRGDGSYDARKNMFRYNTVSGELAYAFRDALLRLGIAASVNYQERQAPRQPIYAVVISSPFNARFGEGTVSQLQWRQGAGASWLPRGRKRDQGR